MPSLTRVGTHQHLTPVRGGLMSWSPCRLWASSLPHQTVGPAAFAGSGPNRSKVNLCWVFDPPDHSHRFLCFGSTGGLLGARPTLQEESLVHVGPIVFLCFMVFLLGCFVEVTPSVPFSVCVGYYFPQHVLFCQISKSVRVDCCSSSSSK
jgi:hypothetical protein